MTVEATLRGDGCRLTLRVHGYEFHEAATGEAADWLVADIELQVGTTGAFRGNHHGTLYARDLARFTDELRALDRDLTGQATFDDIEGHVGMAIILTAGRGTLAGYLGEHVGVTLGFEQIPIDQTYVREALQQFDALITAFPPSVA